jgi:hypothetical protein
MRSSEGDNVQNIPLSRFVMNLIQLLAMVRCIRSSSMARGQYARVAIAEEKQRSQRLVIGWVTKNVLSPPSVLRRAR